MNFELQTYLAEYDLKETLFFINEVRGGARSRYPGLLHHVRGGAHHQHHLPRENAAGEGG